jgi:hypothetical protein
MPTGLTVAELEGVDIMVLGRRARCGHGTMPPAFKKTKHCQEDTEMAPPSPPGKRRRITVLEAIVVIGGFIAIIGYNRINIARMQRALPNVNAKIIGEWKAERGQEHLVFRSDESVSMTVPGPPSGENMAETTPNTIGPPPVTGKYKLTQGGRIYVQLMNGKNYNTTISPINPNRFDLIDSETEGVTTYDRVSTPPAGDGKAASGAPSAPEAPSTAGAPAVPEAPSGADAPVVPEAPSGADAPVVPEAPSGADAPVVPEAPSTAEAPAVHEAPSSAEAPAAKKNHP